VVLLVKGGFSFYGQKIGILVFNQKSPRVPGDPGHSATFDFPVCYEIVNGSFSELINGSQKVEEQLIKSIKNLENKGIKAVVGDCGLMALYQRKMAGATNLSVLSSSLLLVPLIWDLIGREGSIGIITGHSELLNEKHMIGAGITEDINVTIQGMEEEPHFSEVVIKGGLELDTELMKKDVLSAVEKIVKRDNKIKAILLECSNLASYSKYVYDAFNIPVYDVVIGANILEYSVNPPRYI